MAPYTTSAPLTIGELSRRSGCTVPTIRYYEQIGLIPPARRRPSGHRVYDTTAQDLLIFVRGCREYGFPIEQIRALVALTHSNCVETRDIAQTHLDAVRVKLKELGALELSLAKFVESCSATRAGGPAPECTILKDLSSINLLTVSKPGCCT